MRATKLMRGGASAVVAALVTLVAINMAVAQSRDVFHATLGETGQKTEEVSTEELRRILAEGSAVVLDSRKHAEYVAGHIAGARNVSLPADAPPSEFAAAVAQLLGGDKSRPLVLYCNGQYCQASRTLSDQLVAAGFTNVRRYQLGIPMWRALNGPVEIELEGILRVYKIDQTALFLDARTAADFAKASLPGTHNVPADQLAAGALSKAPMPRDDFNTRIILFGKDRGEARALADAIGKSAMQNVSYFPGTYDALAAALNGK